MWIIVAAAGTGFFIYLVLSMALVSKKQQRLEAQLNEIAEMGESEDQTVRIWEGSLLGRASKAIFRRLVATVGSVIPISLKENERIRILMIQAGLNLQAEEYMVIQILMVLGGAALGYYIGAVFQLGRMLPIVLGLYGGYTIFRFFFSQRISKRKELILNQMPDILDLLSISVEAGLSFNQAFQYVAEQCEGALVEEIVYAGRAMALGRSRRAALEDMADRCGLDEVRTFTSAVIQADEMGISLKNILVTQAHEARNAKRMRTEERAQKVPIKMLLPMGVLIFPVLLIILMAPSVPRIMESLL